MPDVATVAAARKRVATAYNDWLKKTYETKLSEMGSTKARGALPKIGPDGAWADVGIQGKPLAWIVRFSQNAGGSWSASLPRSNYPYRLGGSFNARSPLQGVLTRVLPVVNVGDGRCVPHPYWEWALAFVFPGRPVFRDEGSSGAVIEYNPETGRLWSPINERQVDQPYVESGLFALVNRNDDWHPTLEALEGQTPLLGAGNASVHLTYGEATDALSGFLTVEHAPPAAPEAEK